MSETKPFNAPEQLNLTSGSPWRNIWQMSWPMVLIMLFNFVVMFVDVYVAGLISPAVQAAVGFVSQIYFLVIILANAISIGTVAIVSRAIGANDFPDALSVAKQSLVFGASVAAALTIIVALFCRDIVEFAGFPAETQEIAADFLRIFGFALGPNYLLLIANAVFRASGEPLKPLLTMFLVAVINVAAVWYLVFQAEFGYRGIAIANAIALCAGSLITFLLFLRSRWLPLCRGPFVFAFASVRRVFSISWPSAALQIAWNAGTIILYNMLGRLGGESITALAALTSGLRIEAILFMPVFALNMAASVLMGQNLGAGNPARAQELGWKTAAAGAVCVSVPAIGIFIAADDVASLLARDASVLEETVRYLRYNMAVAPIMALSVILGGGLQGAGDTRGTMWVIIRAMWLVRLPLAAALMFWAGLGAQGVWIAMVASMVVQTVLMVRRFQSGVWKQVRHAADRER